MSDLIISYEKLSIPPVDCTQDPPATTQQNPSPKDGCSITVPLI